MEIIFLVPNNYTYDQIIMESFYKRKIKLTIYI